MDLSIKAPNVEAKPYKLITYSNISDFLTCPMKFYFRNIVKIIPMKQSAALTIGAIFHNAIEEYYKLSKEEIDKDALNSIFIKITEECNKKSNYIESNDDIMIQGMVNGWVHHFSKSKYKIVKNEILFDIPFEDGEYHRCGKTDAKIINDKDQLFLGEWKTTGQISTFVKKIQVDNQGNNYLWAFEDDKPEGVIFRIAKKSLLRIKKGESLIDFRERIFDDYISRPNENFHEEIVHLDVIGLKRWKYEVGQICDMIKLFSKEDGWYRNTNACWNYNNLCPYNMICKITNKKDFESVKNSHYLYCEPGQELFEINE